MIVRDFPSMTLGALDAEAVFDVSDADAVSMQVTGTFVGTVSFYTSNDNTNWWPVSMSAAASTSTTGASTTTTGLWARNVTLVGSYLKAKMTAYTSGAAVVKTVSTRQSK